MKQIRLSIAARLALLLLLPVVTIVPIFGYLTYRNAQDALRDAVVADLTARAQEKTAALNAWMNGRVGDVQTIERLPGFIENTALLASLHPLSPATPDLRDTVTQYLTARTETSQDYLALSVLDAATGRIIASSAPEDVGQWRPTTIYFLEGREATFVQEPFFSELDEQPAFGVATLLKNEKGETIAVLAARISLGALNRILTGRSDLRQTGDVLAINRDRYAVTQPRFEPSADILHRRIDSQAARQCVTGESGILLTPDYRGIPHIISYTWLADHSLCLIAKLEQTEAFAPIRALQRTMWVVAGTGALAVLLLATLLARAFVRPILAMRAGARRFGSGELGVRLLIHSRDEVGELAAEFNAMAASIEEKEAQLRDYAATLKQKVEERTAALLASEEELRRSNAELEQFAYVASHDLQEPLRMVSGYLKLLDRRYYNKLDEDGREFIGHAVDGATRMKSLIDDLLALSRVGTHGKPLRPTGAPSALSIALEYLRPVIDDTAATVTHDEMPWVMGDGQQLVQLFQNLIGNALKFHGEKSPVVHISAERHEVAGWWQFGIHDKGIGIEPRFFERIFVIFQRLHTRGDYEGTGIGLAMCKKIVDRHGGQIWVESAPGCGSTFYFSLQQADLPEGNAPEDGVAQPVVAQGEWVNASV